MGYYYNNITSRFQLKKIADLKRGFYEIFISIKEKIKVNENGNSSFSGKLICYITNFSDGKNWDLQILWGTTLGDR